MVMDFKFPDVGEGLVDGEIVRWLAAEGSSVSVDQEFVEIETDKAVVAITSPVTGILERHGAPEGGVVLVGETLAVFSTETEDEVDPNRSLGPNADSKTGIGSHSAYVRENSEFTSAANSLPTEKPRATPATRRYARERGVSLAEVTGSGKAGRITRSDIEGYLSRHGSQGDDAEMSMAEKESIREGKPPSALEEKVVPIRGIRRAVFRSMSTSWATVPHVNAFNEVDMSEINRLRQELVAEGVKIPLTAFLIRAVASALREFPVLNASVEAEAQQIHYHGHINIGVAIDSPDGLVVPVVNDADQLSVLEIGMRLGSLVASASDRSLSPEELSGGTFTVNNYGPLGGWFGTSLVKPPEVGILSLGRARENLVIRDGETVTRLIATVALAADHRVADGRELIGFGAAVQRRLEIPSLILAEV